MVIVYLFQEKIHIIIQDIHYIQQIQQHNKIRNGVGYMI